MKFDLKRLGILYMFIILVLNLNTVNNYVTINTCYGDSSGDIIINEDGNISPVNSPIEKIDGIYYLNDDILSRTIIIKKDGMVLDGDGYILSGIGSPNSIGIKTEGVNNIVIKNLVIINWNYGINIEDSDNNKIFGNSFINNVYAINLDSNSDSNEIFHNYFKEQVVRSSSQNIWSHGYEGNHWTDLELSDRFHGLYQNNVGPDGIIDSPEFIDEENIDSYPLMGNITSYSFADTPVVIVSNYSNSASYNYENNFIQLYVTSSSSEIGFCRISIPHTLVDPNEMEIKLNYGTMTPIYDNLNVLENGTHRWIYFTPDVVAPSIEDVHQEPDLDKVHSGEAVNVYSTVTDQITSQDAGTIVFYHVLAVDNEDNQVESSQTQYEVKEASTSPFNDNITYILGAGILIIIAIFYLRSKNV